MKVKNRREECAETSGCKLNVTSQKRTNKEESKGNEGVSAPGREAEKMKWENRWCVSTELCRRERERRGGKKGK